MTEPTRRPPVCETVWAWWVNSPTRPAQATCAPTEGLVRARYGQATAQSCGDARRTGAIPSEDDERVGLNGLVKRISGLLLPEVPGVVHAAMTATPTRPPSTSITVPCTNMASSLARYTAAWAMASGIPLPPAGVPRIMPSAGSSASPPDSPGAGVRITPGDMALTRTPAAPNSAAHARVRVSTAPLGEL